MPWHQFWYEFTKELAVGWHVFLYGPEAWLAIPVILGVIFLICICFIGNGRK